MFGRRSVAIFFKSDCIVCPEQFKFVDNFRDWEQAFSALSATIRSSKRVEENIKNTILRRGSILYNEVEFLLHEELREPSTYNTVIEAVALGNTEYNAILSKTLIEQRTLSVYIKNLTNLGILKKEKPSLSKPKENFG